ncbi:MAG: hypothetical protein ACW986_02805 [Promethearchaeota archaeon]|jgi:hypothetical protein
MQIFEVVELTEFPFMETKEIADGTTVSNVINDTSEGKVFLIVDHDTKSIWTYNCPKSSLKIQVYGGILAGMLRQQLRLFYRVHLLNKFSPEDKKFQELMGKPMGVGRALPIEKKEFSKPTPDKFVIDMSVKTPHMKKALEYLDQFPKPDNLVRRFIIIGGQIFTDEEVIETFVKEEKSIIKSVKLGRLNNGFTLFTDHNYSTRLIIKDRKIQGIELFINKDDTSSTLILDIPTIYEEKFNKPGSIETLLKAFNIPDQLPNEVEGNEEEREEEEIESPPQNDSSN